MRNMIAVFTIFISSFAQAKSFSDRHKDVITAIHNAAVTEGIPEDVLAAVCWHESNFNNKTSTHMDNGSLSFGICQIKLATARFMDKIHHNPNPISARVLDTVHMNAVYAAQYLKYNLEVYDGDWALAIDAYNKGRAVSANSMYVNRIKESLAYLKKKMDTK